MKVNKDLRNGKVKPEYGIDDMPFMRKLIPEFLLLHSYLLGHNFIVNNFTIDMCEDLHPLYLIFKDNDTYNAVPEIVLYGVKGWFNLLPKEVFEFKYGKDVEWKIYFSIEVK